MNTRGRKWIDREIAALDPDVDFDKIVSIIGQYRLNEFMMDVGYVVNFLGVTQAPQGADVLAYTRKVFDQQQKRFEDSLIFFWTVYVYGSQSPEIRRYVERLNRRHASIAKKVPGEFASNDDYLMPMAQLAAYEHRLLQLAGMPELTPHMKRAWYNFIRSLSTLFVRHDGGPIENLPEDYDGLLRFADDFEARDWPATENGHLVAEAFIQQFCDRWFPRPLHFVGRTIILTILPPKRRRVVALEKPNVVGEALVKSTLRLMMFAQRILPDPKVSVFEKKPSKRDSPVLRRMKEHGAIDANARALSSV